MYELKHAIDRCVRKPWDTMAAAHLERLLEDNPRSARSTHVMYNIGPTRRKWLVMVLLGMGARGRALLPGPDDHSFVR